MIRSMYPEKEKVTRGNGFLESLLARKRAKMADSLIPANWRAGVIADIGCGNYPYFLLNTEFKQKYGLDKIANDCHFSKAAAGNITILNYDLECEFDLPLSGDSCDAITMLAVLEHIEPEFVPPMLSQVHAALRKGGGIVLTTPAFWTQPILNILSALGLVSKEEIEEHKKAYRLSDIFKILQSAGFKQNNMHGGYFELGMNLWVKAIKG